MIEFKRCKERAVELLRIIKPGGYVLIFGHPKTNHRMKCAFEDVGFKSKMSLAVANVVNECLEEREK